MNKDSDVGTKRKFMEKALMLFAEKGYEAVSVAQIASAVGCSAPALYKHYKSKQELFDAIMAESEKGFKTQMEKFHVDFTSHPEEKQRYLSISEEEEIEIIQNVTRSTIEDEFVSAFRKMLLVEQFHYPELAEMYNYRYITYQYEQHAELFKMFMEEGKMKKADPMVLARMYMSVPIVAIGICDREPERIDECMEMIKQHIKEFNRCYKTL